MSNKHFWDEVMNGLDEKMTDNVASDLFLHQKKTDVDMSDCIVRADNGEVTGNSRKNNGFLALAACIVIMACLATVTVFIVKNSIKVQPLDSSDEYSYLLEETKYTHSVNVYFLEKELGEEFIENPDILNNKMIASSVETYLFAGNFEEEFYVFGDIKKENELKKTYFDDPIGGMSGKSREGWNISFNPELLDFVCNEEALKEFCDKKYKFGAIEKKIEEITDVFMVCIPNYPALIHFKDGNERYFINLQMNVLYGDNTLYDLFTYERFVEHFKVKERPISINSDEVVEGYAAGNLVGYGEINVTKLLEHIVDDEFIVREGSKISYYRWNMETAEKFLVAVVDSEAQIIEVYPSRRSEETLYTDSWNKDDYISTFRQGELYMNYNAALTFLRRYGILFYFDIAEDGLSVFYDEKCNPFTPDTNFMGTDDFRFKGSQYGPLYEEDGKAKLHLSARLPYATLYDGLPITFELTVEDNGKPVLINGKESYKVTKTISTMESEIEDDVYIDVDTVAFNEYGYSNGLKVYLTYTVDASEIISGKIESHTISQEITVRNNPDDITEEELIVSNPVIKNCKKLSDGEWAITVDLSVITDIKKDVYLDLLFSDENDNSVTMVIPGRADEKEIENISFTQKKEDSPTIDVILKNVDDASALMLDMDIVSIDTRECELNYKEKFLLTE